MTTAEVDLHALMERIEKLETGNRRWRLGSLMALLVLASSLTMGLMPQERTEPALLRAKTVEARSFLLRDVHGEVRGRLTMKGDRPSLEFYDLAEKVVWSAPPKPGMVPAR